MLEIIYDNLPWFWLAVAILCTVIEAFTFGLATIWFAIGAVVMIFLSFAPIPFPWQILIFLVMSSLLLIFSRPLAIKKLKVGKEKTNTDGLIGKNALVVKEITHFDKGEVKIHGVIWSAMATDEGKIPEGCECIIESIEGATLKVRPKDKKEV